MLLTITSTTPPATDLGGWRSRAVAVPTTHQPHQPGPPACLPVGGCGGARAERRPRAGGRRLLERTRARSHNATAFAESYRRYHWATDGLNDVRLAPFQVPATNGATFETHAHEWHMGLGDRLAAGGGEGMVVKPLANLVRTPDEGWSSPA